MRIIVAAAAALMLAGSAAQADGKMTITPELWASFQQYSAWLTSIGRGFYAVTEDGKGGAGSGCPTSNCKAGESLRSMAIASCEKLSPGHHCVIFAENQEPVVEYEIKH